MTLQGNRTFLYIECLVSQFTSICLQAMTANPGRAQDAQALLRLCSGSAQALLRLAQALLRHAHPRLRYAHPQLRLKQQLLTSAD